MLTGIPVPMYRRILRLPASAEQSTKKKFSSSYTTIKLTQQAANTRGVISKQTGISILCVYKLNGDNYSRVVYGWDNLRPTTATVSWSAHSLRIPHQQTTLSSLPQPKWENLPKRTHTDTIRALAPQGISREPDGTEHHSRCPLQAIKLSPTPHTSTISTKTSSRTALLFCFLLL
jgi:hypothetical protein